MDDDLSWDLAAQIVDMLIINKMLKEDDRLGATVITQHQIEYPPGKPYLPEKGQNCGRSYG